MRRTALFVDYAYQKGHVNFNKIHIDALRADGYDVKIVLHRDIMKRLPYGKDDYALILPNLLKLRDGHAVINRISFILSLLLIRIIIRVRKFDKVVVSYCDEVTLGLLPLCRGMYIICHNNAASFDNKVKRYFMHRLSKHNHFIVFNDEMTKPFKRQGINNVLVVSHGCVPPFTMKPDIQLPLNISSYDKVVFHPSPKPDVDFVTELMQNARLADFLRENNVLLILRNSPCCVCETSNIKFINEYLSQDQYQKLFLSSDVILLAYPPTFEYRVSGVSFECVANGKKMLIKANHAFDYCRDFLNYDPMFNDVGELCIKLDYLFHHPNAMCKAIKDRLTPDYKSIFND